MTHEVLRQHVLRILNCRQIDQRNERIFWKLADDSGAARKTAHAAHIYRSEFVDKCAEAERYICHLIAQRGGAIGKTCVLPLSQKIDRLRAVLAEPPASAKCDKLIEVLNELGPLSDFRSVLVHSTMSPARLDEDEVIILHNSSDSHRRFGERALFSWVDLRITNTKLDRAVNRLKHAAEVHATPPAPHPPEPDAAAGP
jgi:hypothetical protein